MANEASSVTGPNATNTRPTKPCRATVLADLTALHGKLARAEAEHDQGTANMTRGDIDEQLERLHQCIDPAGVASESEWGKAG